MNGKVYINSICDRCAHIDVCDSHKDNRQKCGCYLEQRPHGEWVLDKEISFIFNIYECSKCRFNGSKRWHFCPNCGSDNRPRILDEAVDGEGKDGNVKEDFDRPHGKWILVKPYTFACSLCGRLEEHQEPFCNCGAKMEMRVGESE